jgi:multidrug efflux system outer membrane protein
VRRGRRFFSAHLLTGSVGTASTHLSGLFQNTAWTLAPQLLQPLFDAGRNQANLDSAVQGGREIAVAQYEKAIQTAFREVADALAGRATLGEQRAAQEAQAAAETRRLALADLLLKNGATSAAGAAGRRTCPAGRAPGRGAGATGNHCRPV